MGNYWSKEIKSWKELANNTVYLYIFSSAALQRGNKLYSKNDIPLLVYPSHLYNTTPQVQQLFPCQIKLLRDDLDENNYLNIADEYVRNKVEEIWEFGFIPSYQDIKKIIDIHTINGFNNLSALHILIQQFVQQEKYDKKTEDVNLLLEYLRNQLMVVIKVYRFLLLLNEHIMLSRIDKENVDCEIHQYLTFSHLTMLMQNFQHDLAVITPRLIEELLEHCNSYRLDYFEFYQVDSFQLPLLLQEEICEELLQQLADPINLSKLFLKYYNSEINNWPFIKNIWSTQLKELLLFINTLVNINVPDLDRRHSFPIIAFLDHKVEEEQLEIGVNVFHVGIPNSCQDSQFLKKLAVKTLYYELE